MASTNAQCFEAQLRKFRIKEVKLPSKFDGEDG